MKVTKERIRMKRISTFAISICVVALTSCGMMKGLEHDITVAIRNNGELYYSGVVNEFNNIILPKMDKSYIQEGMKFAGYTVDKNWTVEDGLDLLYKEGTLLRYKNIKQYAYGGGVELHSQFVSQDTPLTLQHYVTLGWYNKPGTSGLTENIIKKLTADLTTYLKDNGATDEDLKDFVVKGYEGNVGAIGSAINEDDNVDVFVGAGKNLKSTGGVDFVERFEATQNYGSVDSRWVYLLRDKPAARLVYDYCNSDAFYSIFN